MSHQRDLQNIVTLTGAENKSSWSNKSHRCYHHDINDYYSCTADTWLTSRLAKKHSVVHGNRPWQSGQYIQWPSLQLPGPNGAGEHHGMTEAKMDEYSTLDLSTSERTNLHQHTASHEYSTLDRLEDHLLRLVHSTWTELNCSSRNELSWTDMNINKLTQLHNVGHAHQCHDYTSITGCSESIMDSAWRVLDMYWYSKAAICSLRTGVHAGVQFSSCAVNKC